MKENNFLRSDDETNTENSIKTAKNENYFGDYFDIDKIDNKEIPKEYVPNFKISYQWIRTNRVHFFYYPDSLRLIVYVTWS